MPSSDTSKAVVEGRETPLLQVSSLDDPFRAGATSRLAALLPDFIATRRWYRAKARTLQDVAIEDLIAISGIDAWILVLRMSYADGESDCYLLPVAIAPPQRSEPEEVIAALRAADGAEAVLYSAFSSRPFRDALLGAIASNSRLEGQSGDLIASRTSAFEPSSDLNTESFVSGAEQSNTSIVYRDRFILKLFRKIEPGINPDIEIGEFLTEHGFKNTPAMLGKLEYRPKEGGIVYSAGILQKFVRNQGDAWKYTLESLQEFFRRALASGKAAPPLASHHPMEIATDPAPPEIRQWLGSYADSARLLGVRTAEMHAALADPHAGPDFAPEPFTSVNGQKVFEEVLSEADIAFELLRRKLPALTGAAAEDARTLLRTAHRVADRLSPLRGRPITATRIRFHGDYHLGQVLFTGSDFMIIDFEGEPARPLNQRRSKGLALRDVAGMIRSFQYAAYSGLFEQAGRVALDSETHETAESWSAFWNVWIGAIYLQGYFDTAEGSAFIPSGLDERRTLLDAFLLQKALYEVIYELNNRPHWVRIPLRGVLSLLD